MQLRLKNGTLLESVLSKHLPDFRTFLASRPALESQIYIVGSNLEDAFDIYNELVPLLPDVTSFFCLLEHNDISSLMSIRGNTGMFAVVGKRSSPQDVMLNAIRLSIAGFAESIKAEPNSLIFTLG